MRTGGRGLLIGLAKFVAVLVAGAAVGAGVGYGLSALSGDGGGAGTSVAAATTSTPATTPTPTPTPTSTSTSNPTPAKVKKARVSVSGASFDPATSTLTLQVRASNLGTKVIQSRHPAVVLPAGAAEATAGSGGLLDPIGPGHKATGSLRFVTSGEVTTQVAAGTSAELSMFHRKVPVPAPAAG